MAQLTAPPGSTDPVVEPALDQDGHLQDYLTWTPQLACRMASQQHLQLTEWHMQILLAVREFYRLFGYAPPTRPLIKFLIKQLGPSITNAQLMHAFQTGLVARTLARLAGLPKPANCL